MLHAKVRRVVKNDIPNRPRVISRHEVLVTENKKFREDFPDWLRAKKKGTGKFPTLAEAAKRFEKSETQLRAKMRSEYQCNYEQYCAHIERLMSSPNP